MIEQISNKNIESVVSVHTQAQISNDAVENELIHDIIDTVYTGGNLDSLIEDAHLPFPIDVPQVPAEIQLEQIIDISGGDLVDIKSNPNFDSFLASLLAEFDAVKAAPSAPGAPATPTNDIFVAEAPSAIGAPDFANPAHFIIDAIAKPANDFSAPARPTAFGGAERPEAFGAVDRPTNDFAYPEAPAAFGGAERPEAFGAVDRPSNDFAYPARPAAFGGAERPEAFGAVERPQAFGGAERPVAFGKVDRPSNDFAHPARPQAFGHVSGPSRHQVIVKPVETEERDYIEESYELEAELEYSTLEEEVEIEESSDDEEEAVRSWGPKGPRSSYNGPRGGQRGGPRGGPQGPRGYPGYNPYLAAASEEAEAEVEAESDSINLEDSRSRYGPRPGHQGRSQQGPRGRPGPSPYGPTGTDSEGEETITTYVHGPNGFRGGYKTEERVSFVRPEHAQRGPREARGPQREHRQP